MSKSTTTATPKTSTVARAVKTARTETSKNARSAWLATVANRKIAETVISMLMAGESAKQADRFTRSAFKKISADKATVCRLVVRDISSSPDWDVLGEDVMVQVLTVFVQKRSEILLKMRLAGPEGRKAHRAGIVALKAETKFVEAKKLPASAIKRLASAEAMYLEASGNPEDIIS